MYFDSGSGMSCSLLTRSAALATAHPATNLNEEFTNDFFIDKYISPSVIPLSAHLAVYLFTAFAGMLPTIQ
jgi:hypothetical protein